MGHLTLAGRRKLDELRARSIDDLSTVELFELSTLRKFEQADKVRRLVAELVVIDTYDDHRRFAGHDYGSGQRARELARLRRDLVRAQEAARVDVNEYPDDEAAEAYGVTPADLHLAARRLLVPRLRRIETAETYRRNTPSSLRTITALRRSLKRFGIELKV